MPKVRIKKGDKVMVIAGASKGKEGEVVNILKKDNKAIVANLNMVKRHKKGDANNPKGGIVEKEAPIHLSNLSLLTSDGVPTRVGYRLEGTTKVRYGKKTGEAL